MILKDNERLVYAGMSDVRSPSGKPLPMQPVFKRVLVEDADPADIVEVKAEDRYVPVGIEVINGDIPKARYEAIEKGVEYVGPPQPPAVEIYRQSDTADIDYDAAIASLMQMHATHIKMRKEAKLPLPGYEDMEDM